jgi:hypothetical protein
MVSGRLKLIDTAELKAKSYRLPEPLRALRDMTKKFLAQRLSDVFEHVDDAFFDLADRAESNAEQADYFDAMRMIRLERKIIEQKFSTSINQAFHHLGNVNYEGVSASVSEMPEAADLEVLENEELEEAIAINSMVAKVTQHQEHELKKMMARINFLVPAEVTASNNPVGPDVVCHALNTASEGLDIDIRSKLMLFKLLDRHLVEGLSELLKDGNALLREMGVLPDLDKKHQARKPKAKSPSQPPAASALSEELSSLAATHEEGGVGGQDDDQFLSQLQSLLQQSDMAAPMGSGETVALNDLVHLVSNLQGEWATRPNEEQSLLGLIQGKLQSRGNVALGARNQSVVHLLDRLFDNIRHEPSISQGLSQELRKLEMPILRIALEDSSFFSKEKHPARQLLNEITAASIGYSDEVDFTSDPVGKAIANVASILNKSESLDRDTLSKLLMNFMTLVEKEQRGSSVREQRILEEVEAKEKVNQARQLVDSALAERMEGKKFPQVLVTFAETAWCKVMFMACLRSDKTPELWESSIDVLDRLLDAAAGTASKESMSELISTVRSRLEDISFDPYELGCLIGGLEQFFDPTFIADENEVPAEPSAAVSVHADVEAPIVDLNKLPEAKVSEAGVSESGQAKTESPKTAAPKTSATEVGVNESCAGNNAVASGAKANAQPELLTSEMLKEVTVDGLQADIPGRPLEQEVEQDQVEDEFVKIAEALGRGSWVDFMDQEPPNRRCKVAGIISPPGKYIFVNRQGAKVVEMNQNAVAGGIKEKSLVVVESVRMFDRALEQVIRGIRSNRQVH